MKALKGYNTEAITRFQQRKVHNTEIVEIPQDDPPGPPVKDLAQALQTYQAYQVPCPQDSTMTPERSINTILPTI